MEDAKEYIKSIFGEKPPAKKARQYVQSVADVLTPLGGKPRKTTKKKPVKRRRNNKERDNVKQLE